MILLKKIISVIKNWIVKNKKYFIASIVLGLITAIAFYIYLIIFIGTNKELSALFILETIFLYLVLSILFFIGYFFLIMLLRFVYIGAEEFINDFLVYGLLGRLILVVAFCSIIYGHYKRAGPDRYSIFIYIAIPIFIPILVLFNKRRK
jgi:hypothetical protein